MASKHDIYQKALDLLARREHSKLELANKLINRYGDSADINLVIEELISKQYLSEERYVNSILNHRSNMGYGPYWIKAYLNKNGVDDALVVEALHNSKINWLDVANKIRQKKFGAVLPNGYTKLAKEKNFLQTRGFSHEQINSIYIAMDNN